MTNEDSVEKALELALEAHENQKDKAGEEYILHPIRVMQSVEFKDEKVVALLHDVVEDSSKSFEDLEEHFSEGIVSAVRCVTKKENESYSQFVGRAKSNSIAREVKMADIRDNMDLGRLEEVTEADLDRMKKYHKGLKYLEGGVLK